MVDDHRVDVRDSDSIQEIFERTQPEMVFHLAAQALVRPSYEYPLDTFSTNAMGTASVMEAIRKLNKPLVAIMITSDKAYNNVEWEQGYIETDRLGGKDPYSASKGMAELAIYSYLHSYFTNPDTEVRLCIARAGNVIGGGDWATDRIVPDCIRAWSENKSVDIRSPHATRPWQHVLEPLSGYLALAANLTQSTKLHGEPYNFGPPETQNHSVGTLIDEMAKHWDHVKWNDVSKSKEHVHEAGLLQLNCNKALNDLQWAPTLDFEETVMMTIDWYREYYEAGQSMNSFTMYQIEQYAVLAEKRGATWATV
jgi:CDP-glucose 4,6-dehydratase